MTIQRWTTSDEAAAGDVVVGAVHYDCAVLEY
jgi:hypothetical protein